MPFHRRVGFPPRLCVASLLVAAGVAATLGCGSRPPTPSACVWVVGADGPAFDPAGPPDASRWALERLLTHGLVEEDSSGRILPAAAARIEVSPDSLLYTFHLREGLRFSDDSPCRSADFRRALEAGLTRPDHATRVWLLGALRGVDRVRAGRPVPPLGIETPDESTLTLQLVQPDPWLLHKLALPGVSSPWANVESGSWKEALGIGSYRVIEEEAGKRLRMVRTRPAARSDAGADTIVVRFERGAARVRTLLRAGRPDLVWPLPPELLDEALPGQYQSVIHDASPQRVLLLVMRADVPPTTKLAARRALAHGINRSELVRALGPVAEELDAWLPNADRFEFPKLDGDEVRRWLEQGKLGRSFHVVLSYDADGPAAPLARILQGTWARLSIYVELRPVKGSGSLTEALRGRSHLILVAAQSLLEDPAADLAALVMPLRGPAVGSFRTGWRTREFDPWLLPNPTRTPFPASRAQRRLEEETVALPLGRLPWVWVEREGGSGLGFHPHFGPDCSGFRKPSAPKR